MFQEIISLRTEKNKTFNLGGNKRRLVCHCKPIHYKNGRNEWEDIVLDFQDDGLGNFITDKNKVSVGFRKDLKLEKYFGLRYDYDHQFEGTIKEIKLDNIEQIQNNKVNSLQRKSKIEVIHQLNSGIEILNRVNEVGLKNFVKVNNPIGDFKIVEEIHLKGLSCSNKKDGNSYIPDKYGRFCFIDEKGELKFWINPPFFEDNSGNLSSNLEHTLQEIDGHLIYTKIPSKRGKDDLALAQYPILIDTNTYYSSTADGYVRYFNAETWDEAHDAETGTEVSTITQKNDWMIAANYTLKDETYYINRTFFYFDTSDLPDAATITAAVMSLYRYSNAGGDESDVCAMKGTQADTLAEEDFDSFSGSAYGYADWTGGVDRYIGITFNAQGRSDINKTGVTKICCREYSHDYLDVPHTDDGLYDNGCYFADQAGTTYDPKLEIDYTEAAGPTNLKSVNGVAKASIKSINGIALASVKGINTIT